MFDCCGCGKIVDVVVFQVRQCCVLGIVLVINLVMFVMMVGVVWWSYLFLLFFGSLDNLGDVFIYVISLVVVSVFVWVKGCVVFLKGLLIFGVVLVVVVQIGWWFIYFVVLLFEGMGIVGVLNLVVNGVCFWLFMFFCYGDVNLVLVWECLCNDIVEGVVVLLVVFVVWVFGVGWLDLLIVGVLLVMFLCLVVCVLCVVWQVLCVQVMLNMLVVCQLLFYDVYFLFLLFC